MASDPADLIREADDFLHGVPSGVPNVEAISLVRRLRDALEVAKGMSEVAMGGIEQVIDERDEARAALAEANATIDALRDRVGIEVRDRDQWEANTEAAMDTIEQVEHVLDLVEDRADDYVMPGASGDVIRGIVGRIRRAIKGEQP